MAVVDDTQWPLVLVNWPPGQLTDELVEETLIILSRYYGRRHAVLHDGLLVSGMSAQQRKRMMQYTAIHEEEIRRWVVASAAVIESAFWRGIITLIQHASPPPCPVRNFSDREEAQQWLLQALRREGLWRPSPETPPAVPSS